MKYQVTKELSFCYGHRLLNYDGKCHMLHGHNGRVEITVGSDELNEQGFVVDFTDIKNTVGKWIDENLDHKTILQLGDPIIGALEVLHEPHVVWPVPPTAEFIAKRIYIETERRMSSGISVVSVRLWETPTSFAEVCE